MWLGDWCDLFVFFFLFRIRSEWFVHFLGASGSQFTNLMVVASDWMGNIINFIQFLTQSYRMALEHWEYNMNDI